MVQIHPNPLAGDLGSIVNRMRLTILDRGTAEEVPSALGWRHGGPRLMDEITLLKTELQNQGKPVTTCKAYHFFKEVKVKSPTNRLILIPICGTAIFKKGEPLLPGFYYDLEQDTIIMGENFDMILIVLQKKP